MVSWNRPAPTPPPDAAPLLVRAPSHAAVRARAWAEGARAGWAYSAGRRLGTEVGLQLTGDAGTHAASGPDPELSLQLERHLERVGVGWRKLGDLLASAPDVRAAHAIVRRAFPGAPLARHLLLLRYAPDPIPGWLLEQTQAYDQSARDPGLRRRRLIQARPQAALVTRAAVVLDAAAPLGSPAAAGLRDLSAALPYSVPVAEWAELLAGGLRAPHVTMAPGETEPPGSPTDWTPEDARRAAQTALRHRVLSCSFSLTMARVVAGDMGAYAAVAALPSATLVGVVDALVLPSPLGVAGSQSRPDAHVEHRLLARDLHATVASSTAWQHLCAGRPSAALVLLRHWTGAPGGTPAWWTPAQAAPLLAHSGREERLEVLRLMGRPVVRAPAPRTADPGPNPPSGQRADGDLLWGQDAVRPADDAPEGPAGPYRRR